MITLTDPLDEAVALHEQALSAQADFRFVDAVDSCRRALDMFETHAGPGDPDVANVLVLLAGCLDDLGEHDQAEPLLRRAVGLLADLPAALPDDGDDLDRLRLHAFRGLAANLRHQGRYAAAEANCLAALRLTFHRADPDRAATLNELGVVYKYAGRFDDAEKCYQRALAAAQSATDRDVQQLATLHHNLAGLAHSRGRWAIGEIHGRRSVALRAAALGPDHPTVVADEANLAAILQAAGQLDEAERLLRRAIDTFARTFGPQHLDVAVNLHNLADLLDTRGDAGQAEALYRRALVIKQHRLGAEHPEVALTLYNLAVLLADAGRTGEAGESAVLAHTILASTVDAGHPALVATEALLDALWDR
jgi:tetratricopeptide (TPR) repeat protein